MRTEKRDMTQFLVYDADGELIGDIRQFPDGEDWYVIPRLRHLTEENIAQFTRAFKDVKDLVAKGGKT